MGVRGFGEVHLERIAALQAEGRVELVGVVAPSGLPEGLKVAWFDDLGPALEALRPDVVSIASPMHSHAELATRAVLGGAHVLLEKPPVTSLADFEALLNTAAANQRVVQVGFQSLGSDGIGRLRELVTGDELGGPVQVGARGLWVRDRAYYERSAWAGRRRHQGRRVADGVVTNQLPHAVVTALAALGARHLEDVAGVELELYRANPIEADDTAFVRVELADGSTLCAALTVCAEQEEGATVELRGSRGRASYHYEDDELELVVDGRSSRERFARTDLLANLLDHLEHGADLLVPLEATGAFMAVLEATQSAPDPVPLEDGVSFVGEGDERRAVVADVADWVDRALQSQLGFRELGAPWARCGVTARWVPPQRRGR
ncbi:Gfo/Idh/MocA family oxidoreductase [Luteococcus peritonei]